MHATVVKGTKSLMNESKREKLEYEKHLLTNDKMRTQLRI
jgi:hypothetical protein